VKYPRGVLFSAQLYFVVIFLGTQSLLFIATPSGFNSINTNQWLSSSSFPNGTKWHGDGNEIKVKRERMKEREEAGE